MYDFENRVELIKEKYKNYKSIKFEYFKFSPMHFNEDPKHYLTIHINENEYLMDVLTSGNDILKEIQIDTIDYTFNGNVHISIVKQ